MNFTKTLTRWYSINKREMPWRLTKDPYKIWLSEVILQQTQIKQGLPYYEVFVKKFPKISDLANASEEEILKTWQGLGYYSRARNLHTTAKYISQERNGKFPNSYEELLKLKGIGDYTASAIASICFNKPTAVVDGNVYRVLSRYFGVSTPINSSKGIKEFKTIAQKLIDSDNPGDYNQAIMEFGAVQCKPQSPDCNVCDLQIDCQAYKKNMVHLLPNKLKAIKVKKKHYNYLVIISDDNKTMLTQRTGKGIWQNLYEFPLIESSKSITQKQLLLDDRFQTLIDQRFFDIKLFNKKEIVHKLSHQHLYTKFWIIKLPTLKDNAIATNRINKYPVPVLISNFIASYSF